MADGNLILMDTVAEAAVVNGGLFAMEKEMWGMGRQTVSRIIHELAQWNHCGPVTTRNGRWQRVIFCKPEIDSSLRIIYSIVISNKSIYSPL